MLKPVLAIIGSIIVVFALWTWLTLTWTYADGERVAVHYEEHKWIPFSCSGETGYFVTDVRVAK